MSADLLRRAASLMRERAEGATPGPWIAFDMDSGSPAGQKLNTDGWWWVWQESRLPYYGGVMEGEHHAPNCSGKPETCCHRVVGSAEITDGNDGTQEHADAEHIASWHPAVALAVADWLEHAAARAESKIQHGGKESPVWSHERDALAVARAYMQEDSDV